MSSLLDALATHLGAQNVTRLPDELGTVPVLWREPKGTPAPGEGLTPSDPVVAAFIAPGWPMGPLEGGYRMDAVDLEIRATRSPPATLLEEQIRAVLNDRRGFLMGTMTILDCRITVELFRKSWGPQGYVYQTQYRFFRYT